MTQASISIGKIILHSCGVWTFSQFVWVWPRELFKMLHGKILNNQMVKVCSTMFVQCALKQTKPLLMGKMAVFIWLFCSWRYLLPVSLDYYKIGELRVIIWEPSLPVAVVGVDRHSPLRSRKHTSLLPVFPWAGTACEPVIYFIWASGGKLTSFSYSYNPTLLQNIYMPLVLQIYLYSYIWEEGRRFCSFLGGKGERQFPEGFCYT